ncbi:MAG: dockerin type I domain-containing protein [Planctomycetota bacterium]
MFKTSQLIAILAVCGVAAGFSQASTPIAGVDFDGGTTNGGFTPLTQVFTPDNNANLGFGGDPSPRFPDSPFDLFGIAQGQSSGLPFDLVDQSAGAFLPDVQGIIETTKTDNYVVLADTENNDNSGFVTAQWTFDVSGYENLQISVDFAAMGRFSASDPGMSDFEDYADFRTTIDGGTQETPIQVFIDESQDDADILYDIDLESGSTSEFFFDFFDEGDWNDLIAFGPIGSIGYHPDDNGLDGDDVAQDGFIPEPLLSNPSNETRAYADGGFEDQEIAAYRDPLFAVTSGTSTQLDDEFVTVTADIADTGNTLTLDFRGIINGSDQFFVFDNILITGDLISSLVPGDANGDGQVDTSDLAILAANFGGMGVIGGISIGDFNEDGNIDTSDLAILAANFGFGTGPVVANAAIPEPASLALVAAGMGLAGLRRRRSA